MNPGMEPLGKPEKRKTYREKVLSGEKKPFGWGKRKALNRFSKKGKKSETEYSAAKEEYLERVPFCEICGSPHNLSIHHKSKRGKNKSDPSTFMTTCLLNEQAVYYLRTRFPDANFSGVDGCHSFIEANKKLAREMGWLD